MASFREPLPIRNSDVSGRYRKATLKDEDSGGARTRREAVGPVVAIRRSEARAGDREPQPAPVALARPGQWWVGAHQVDAFEKDVSGRHWGQPSPRPPRLAGRGVA